MTLENLNVTTYKHDITLEMTDSFRVYTMSCLCVVLNDTREEAVVFRPQSSYFTKLVVNFRR